MTAAFIGLGSNIGNREKYLFAASQRIAALEKIQVRRLSPIYETEPVGVKNQPLFLNAVIEMGTFLSPTELLLALQEIEKKLGRKRVVRWGPRTIDLDILLFGSMNISHSRLTVPHAELAKRRFVLVPLADLVPDLIVPGRDASIQELLERCRDPSRITAYSPKQIEWTLSHFR